MPLLPALLISTPVVWTTGYSQAPCDAPGSAETAVSTSCCSLLLTPLHLLSCLFYLLWVAGIPQGIPVLLWVNQSCSPLGCPCPGVGCPRPQSLRDVPPLPWRSSFQECLLLRPQQYPFPHASSQIFLCVSSHDVPNVSICLYIMWLRSYSLEEKNTHLWQP